MFGEIKRMVIRTAKLQASERNYQEYCRRQEEAGRNDTRLRSWRQKYRNFSRFFPGENQ